MFRLPLFATVFFFINVHGQNVSFDNVEIDTYLHGLMKEWKLAGCAVGIVYKDSLIFAEGYGLRDQQKKLPVTRNTLFAIGSNTKLFTGVAAAIVHVLGKLNLDTPVRRYMPQLEFPTVEITQKLTMRDMLSHTSGVPRWDGVWFGAKYSDKELSNKVKYLRSTRNFREAALYNNIYFTLAGNLAGERYGSSWRELITNNIFSPLQMYSSGFGINKLDRKVETGFDYIVLPGSDSLRQLTNADYFCTCVGPAGLIVSNVEDLSHWVIALLNNGVYKKSQAIPAAAIEETSVINNPFYQRFKYQEVRDWGYGLGRTIASYKNHRFLYHGGSAGGYRTEISLFPNDSLGIIVLTNTVQGMGMSAAAVFGIADRMLNLEKTNWSERFMRDQSDAAISRKKELDSIRMLPKKFEGLSRRLKEYEGVYENNIYGPMFITVKENVMRVRFRYVEEELRPLDGDEFLTTERPEYSIYPQLYPVYRLKFLTNAEGVYGLRTSIINDPETDFVKVVKASTNYASAPGNHSR